MKTILILSANPKNTNSLRLGEEAREIEAALERAKNRDEFKIVSKWAVRVDDLRRALPDYKPNIVHFCGHGTGTEGLVLEDNSGVAQLVSSESLASIFELFREIIECVLLNACYSEVQAEAIHQHVDYVIGMNQPIGDVAAIEFATGFYDALGAGESYEYAFRMGRTSIQLKGIPEYLTPVLKSRPSSVAAKNSVESGASSEKNSQPKNSGGISQSVSGGTMYGGMQAAQGNWNQQTMTNYATPQQKHNIAETATTIQEILQNLEQNYPTKTSAEKMLVVAKTVEEIKNQPPLKVRVIEALKAGGTKAFQKAINHHLVNFLLPSLEDWQEAELPNL